MPTMFFMRRHTCDFLKKCKNQSLSPLSPHHNVCPTHTQSLLGDRGLSVRAGRMSDLPRRAKRAILGWGNLTSRLLAENWYIRTEDRIFEVLRGREPGWPDFAEGETRTELKKQRFCYLWCTVWCSNIREGLWDRLGTAILARYIARHPAASRTPLDLTALRDWVCLPATAYGDWEEKRCRRLHLETPAYPSR